MPNQRAAHIKQITLAIDSSLINQAETLAGKLNISRNKTLELLIGQALKQNKGKENK